MTIWQAYGPNFSDDSRVSAPSYGIFQGEKEDVIDWIDLNNPHFRDHLEGHKHPKAELREIKLKEVSRKSVEKLRSALKQKVDADRVLQEALVS